MLFDFFLSDFNATCRKVELLWYIMLLGLASVRAPSKGIQDFETFATHGAGLFTGLLGLYVPVFAGFRYAGLRQPQ